MDIFNMNKMAVFKTILICLLFPGAALCQMAEQDYHLKAQEAFRNNDLYVASENWKKALELNLKHEADTSTAFYTRHLATIYKRLGDRTLNLVYSLQNYEACEAIQDSLEMAGSLVNIGAAHIQLHDFSNAMLYLNQAYDLSVLTGNENARAIALSNIGQILVGQKKFQEALEKLEEASEVLTHLEIWGQLIYLEGIISETYFLMGDYKEAEKMIVKVIATCDKHGSDLYAKGYTVNQYAEILLALKKPHQAIEQINKALKIGENAKIVQIKKVSYMLLSDAYEQLGDYKLAFQNHRLYELLSDSLLNVSRIEKSKEIEAKFRFKEKEKEIVLLKQRDSLNVLKGRAAALVLDKKKRQNQFLITALSAAVLTAILLFLFYRKRRQYSTQILLAKRKEEGQRKMKERFLSQTSHEIRAPLHVITGNTDILSKDFPDNESVEAIQMATNHLLQVVNDILDISRVESGTLPLDKKAIDLKSQIAIYVSMFAESTRRKGQYLKVNISDDIPQFILGDKVRIGQILINLLSNAIKFTEKGTLKLDITKKEGDIIFTVRDNGNGIPLEKRGDIFEIYNQGEIDTYSRFGGSGLGLPISRELSRLMGGDLWLDETGTNGSTFKFRIPLINASPLPKREVAFNLRSPKNLTILVVDDNALSRSTTVKMLHSLGIIGCDELGNVDDALKWMEKKVYDIVLTDIFMPDRNGFELVQSTLLNSLPYEMPLFIGISAYPKEELKQKFGEESVRLIKTYLEKPFGINGLARCLNVPLKSSDNSKELLESDLLKNYEIFISDVPDMLAKSKQYVKQDQLEKAHLLVHKVKPCFFYVGEEDLYDWVGKIEEKMKDMTSDTLLKELEDVSSHTAQLILKFKGSLLNSGNGMHNS